LQQSKSGGTEMTDRLGKIHQDGCTGFGNLIDSVSSPSTMVK
jgi:hypothetical protein